MRFTVVVLLISVRPVTTSAASFDCSKARSRTEKAVCSDASLSRADEEMAAAYKLAKTSTHDVQDQAYLIQSQREWLKYELPTCDDVPCLAKLYKARQENLAFFATQARSPSQPVNPTGSYESMTGLVEIAQIAKGKVRVSMHLSHEENVGTGDREVPIENNVAVYTDPDDPDCRITLTFRNTAAILVQKGMCGFGLNVFAGGTYLKTSNAIPTFSE